MFIECRGKVAKLSGNYTERLAWLVWQSILPCAKSHDYCENDAEHDVGASAPNSSVLFTRKIPLKSEEAKSPAALAAIDKELSGHRARKTWDESTVREYKDLMRDESKAEVITGCVFGILGEVNSEAESQEDKRTKFRAVFQGR